MKLQRILLLAFSFGAGLGCGWLIFTPGTPASSASANPPDSRNPATRPVALAGKPASQPSVPSDPGGILADPVASSRRAALFRALAELTPNNWQPLYEAFMARRKEGRHDDSDWGLFLGAAGAVDGKRVMERLLADIGNLERNPQGEFHYIIRTWVPADRAGALEWLESLPKGLFRDGLWSGYLGGLAEVDLAASIKGVEDMPADVRHYFLWDLAPRVFAQGGLEGADAWLKTVIATNADGSQANQSHVRQVFGLVARRVVETNETSGQPLASIQWLASHANQPYFSQSTWGSAVAAGVRADPAGAMQQFTSLTGNLQNSALNTGMNTWAVADLPAAERWLADRQEAPFYDAAAMGLITHLMKTNAPAAVKWIDSLADPTVRANLRRQVP